MHLNLADGRCRDCEEEERLRRDGSSRLECCCEEAEGVCASDHVEEKVGGAVPLAVLVNVLPVPRQTDCFRFGVCSGWTQRIGMPLSKATRTLPSRFRHLLKTDYSLQAALQWLDRLEGD